MRQFIRLSAWFLALAVVFGMLPGICLTSAAAEPTVGSAVAYATFSSEEITVDGKFSEAAYRLDYPISKKLSFGAAWDWDALYLALTGSVSGLSTLTVNGVSLSIYGTADGTNREIKIPLDQIGIDEIDFAKGYPISFTLDGNTWSGVVYFDTRALTATGAPSVYYGAVKTADGKGVTINTVAPGNNANRSLFSTTTKELAFSEDFPTIVEFDVQVNHMPGYLELGGNTREFCKGGVGVTIRDQDTTLDTNNKYGATAYQLGLGDYGGVMKLIYWADGKYRMANVKDFGNNKFHVRVEYTYESKDEVNARYFVNGYLAAEASNVKHTNGSFSTANTNIIQVVAKALGKTEMDRVDAVVSNFTVSHPKEMVKPADLDYFTQDLVFPRMDLQHIRNDISLPTSFTAKSGITYPLTWTSDHPELVTAEGRVNRHPTERKSVTLSVRSGEQYLWSVLLVLDPLTVQEQESPANVDAAFSASEIVIDGSLDEEGWRMSGRVLTAEKQLFAEYGFQWNQTQLFAAVDFVGEAAALELKLGAKTFTVKDGKLLQGGNAVTGAQIAVQGGVVELAIPVSALGFGDKLSEYGKTMELSVKAGDLLGGGKKLTLTNIDWFVTDNRFHEAPYSGTKSTDVQHGVAQLENGWHMFDQYGVLGSNKTGIRSYVLYQKLPVYAENLADRRAATRVEFDFYAEAMPVLDESAFIDSGAYSNSGFSFSIGDLANANKDAWTVVCGILNTKDGLQFVYQANLGHTNIMVPLSKQVGDKFSVGVEWHDDNRLELYVDGEKIHTLAAAGKYTNSVGNASLCVNMRRSTDKPKSEADNFDISFTNLAMGKVYYNEDVLNQLTFEDIKGENIQEDSITSDLTLPTILTNGQLDNEFTVTWKSSDPEIIDPKTGKVTQMEEGVSVVTLTAVLADGNFKDFELIVPGKTINNFGVLYVPGDLNPATGSGQSYTQQLFTFDTNNNSIIKYLGDVQKINYVVLKDGNDKARLNAESLSLWVSEDNETYVRVESFKLLQVGNQWYLYDFEAEGKYVKVHYTHFHGTEADFVGAFGQMIHAGFEEVFGGRGATFTKSEYTLTNTAASTRYDYAWTVSKKDLGITGTDASIRISLNGELLYHYVSGENVVIRVPEIAPGAAVKLTVQQSQSADVLNIANKEGVHEVVYGTRETTLGSKNRWFLTLPAGTTFPNETKLDKETIYVMGSGSAATVEVSTDGGYTWKAYNVCNNAPAGKEPITKIADGSFLFDSVTGRILYQTYTVITKYNATDMDESHCETSILASDDGGKTWYLMDVLPCACETNEAGIPKYALSYSEGIQLSTYDGDGDNVDFVFPLGTQYDDTGAFATRVAYSRDGGMTWQYSETPITYPASGHEGGCSEAWIIERQDGTLVLHTRCQVSSVNNFKASYSFDHGLTWTDEHYMADYYTTNTQAMLKWLDVDGQQVMTAFWGGNNIRGGTSYIRSPLNFATSVNGGDTFRNIQNIASRTHMEGYSTAYSHYLTNASITQFGEDEMLIAFRQLRAEQNYIRVRIEDFSKWYTRTKGAYDDFEHGNVRFEGWNALSDGMELTTINAQGKYSMKLSAGASVTRSMPYLQNGSVSIDVFVDENSRFTLELQSAYSPGYADVAMPIGLRVENKKLYFNEETTSVAELKDGWNTLTFDLELTEDKAALTVNDANAVQIPVNIEAGDYVCYVTFGVETGVIVDELLVISELDPVLAVTEADRQAADAVVELIKAIEASTDKTAAVQAAREAFDKLTQAQKDLVDVLVKGDGAPVNYYEQLIAAENNLPVDAVIVKINAIGTVTKDSAAAIEAARSAYDALTQEQKDMVTNYSVLTDAEAAFAALEEQGPAGNTTTVLIIVAAAVVVAAGAAILVLRKKRKTK
ncbi:MAG: exo-alpha-sialidase [Oscillospiraceae bacterium]|nr:exo-alpha-sialidase [Oscillospiraceae bacterium]